MARTVVVTGRVQGVWFRRSCRDEAVTAGVAGWVRNLPDGAVEARLEGEAAAIDRVVVWMRHGPPLAVVDDVDIRDDEPEGFTSFEVR